MQPDSGISFTSIAFLIILASNSAGVSMRPMMSLSRFFDSSDLRSFIRSWGQIIQSWGSHFAQQLLKTLNRAVGGCKPTLPRRDLKVCLISCLWALLLCATMSIIASSSVPVDGRSSSVGEARSLELKLYAGSSAFGGPYQNPSWLSSALGHRQRGRSWPQGERLASAEEGKAALEEPDCCFWNKLITNTFLG